MSLQHLLRILAEHSVELFLDGDRLRYRAPTGALTTEMRNAIAASRTDLIIHLRNAVTIAAPGRCATCDRRNWQDEQPKEGRIRTTCGKCGRFIGYRTVDPQIA